VTKITEAGKRVQRRCYDSSLLAALTEVAVAAAELTWIRASLSEERWMFESAVPVGKLVLRELLENPTR